MAWKVKREGELYCVVNDEGGELPLNCHASEEKAIQQMKAENSKLVGAKYGSDDDFKKDIADSSFLYVDVNGRYFQFRGDDGSIDHRMLKSLPKNADFKALDESVQVSIGMTAVNLLSSLGDTSSGVVAKLADMLLGKKAVKGTDFSVWKDFGGGYKFIARYSNNFRDDDYPVREIISKQSHLKFVKLVDEGIVPPPKLLLWHEDDLEFGQADWVAYDDEGFALAGGRIHPGLGELAEAIKGLEDVRMSHGMPIPFIERDGDDESILTQHITEEITVLPGFAAANKRTGFNMLD